MLLPHPGCVSFGNSDQACTQPAPCPGSTHSTQPNSSLCWPLTRPPALPAGWGTGGQGDFLPLNYKHIGEYLGKEVSLINLARFLNRLLLHILSGGTFVCFAVAKPFNIHMYFLISHCVWEGGKYYSDNCPLKLIMDAESFGFFVCLFLCFFPK